MAKIMYQGHGSCRITKTDGKVIFIDPYVGEGYDIPADLILVTHKHGDHCQIHLVTQKPDCRIIDEAAALAGGHHNKFSFDGIEIESVEAGNKNHNPNECVGYIVKTDGVSMYFAGDTSKTKHMESFSDRKLDYAFLPCDGVYNMDTTEAAECARLISAKHNIPVHMKPGELFDMEVAMRFDAPNRMILEPGTEIEL